jgi:hypothetical protein
MNTATPPVAIILRPCSLAEEHPLPNPSTFLLVLIQFAIRGHDSCPTETISISAGFFPGKGGKYRQNHSKEG